MLETGGYRVAAFRAQAEAHGVSPARYESRIIGKTLAPAVGQESFTKPFETGYGMGEKYVTAPSADEIDEKPARDVP